MESKKLTMEQLCQWIVLSASVTDEVLRLQQEFGQERLDQYIEPLLHIETRKTGEMQVKESLGEDPDGFKALTVMLAAALKAYDSYQQLGISDSVYVDTMACFTRFVHEHQVSYKAEGFDREWWTVRQISLQLFRLGELEYEMIQEKGENKISIHIPSNAVLTLEGCRASYHQAVEFFKTYFKEFAYQQMVCESWLLAPALKDILKKDSHIIRFQSQFQITETFPEAEDYREWVYKRSSLPLEQLPEVTSLQRNMKQYLISGGKIGTAYGYLIDHPFLK